METVLNKKTLVPVGAMAVVFSAAALITTIYNQGNANASQIQEAKIQQQSDMDKVDNKLNKISDKLDRLIEKNLF